MLDEIFFRVSSKLGYVRHVVRENDTTKGVNAISTKNASLELLITWECRLRRRSSTNTVVAKKEWYDVFVPLGAGSLHTFVSMWSCGTILVALVYFYVTTR